METVAVADNVGDEHFRVNHAVFGDPPQHVHGNGSRKLDATRRNDLLLLESAILGEARLPHLLRPGGAYEN
jgi:hypothetical protein